MGVGRGVSATWRSRRRLWPAVGETVISTTPLFIPIETPDTGTGGCRQNDGLAGGCGPHQVRRERLRGEGGRGRGRAGQRVAALERRIYAAQCNHPARERPALLLLHCPLLSLSLSLFHWNPIAPLESLSLSPLPPSFAVARLPFACRVRSGTRRGEGGASPGVQREQMRRGSGSASESERAGGAGRGWGLRERAGGGKEADRARGWNRTGGGGRACVHEIAPPGMLGLAAETPRNARRRAGGRRGGHGARRAPAAAAAGRTASGVCSLSPAVVCTLGKSTIQARMISESPPSASSPPLPLARRRRRRPAWTRSSASPGRTSSSCARTRRTRARSSK